ncbi:reticulophagy regulator 3-like isoform X2 [Brienomyrus brachyistius]|uniref:reticulophagy regulator 3-like isoform X2 n=1 Tax=Brienomyrus brachyistius TaxID=42636 RepID=UPI0020B39DA1|nr:reticulophagy regulator 3-like isoform X2 [Brienomyrus brachyistius]
MEDGCSLRGMTADVLLRARPYSSERDARVRALQMAIREWLRPHDRQLLCLQSLLLWERPLQSVLLFSVVNVVFWLLALSSLQLLFLMCSGLVLVVCLDSWRSWARRQVISEPPCENDRSLVHSGILSVLQLSHYVAEMWVHLSSLMGDLVLLRQNSPGKLCLMACGFLTFLAILGCYIPGLLLSYSAVLALLLSPLALQHGVWCWLYLWLEPTLRWLDLMQPPGLICEQKENQSLLRPGRHSATKSNEEELAGFCPKDNYTSASNIAAVEDSEPRDGKMCYGGSWMFGASPGYTALVKGSEDLKKLRDSEDTFACGLGDFPSFCVSDTLMDDNNDSSSDPWDADVHWDDAKLSSRDCEMVDFEMYQSEVDPLASLW